MALKNVFVFCIHFLCVIIQHVTKKQRSDIAKLSYDMVKLTYTGFIIGGIISPSGFNRLHIVFGVSLSVVFFIIGFFFTRKGQ